MLKLASRGHVVVKMQSTQKPGVESDSPLTAADFGMSTNGELLPSQKSKNLYADSTVPSFFRQVRIYALIVVCGHAEIYNLLVSHIPSHTCLRQKVELTVSS